MDLYNIALNSINSLIPSEKVKLLKNVLENIRLSHIHIEYCVNCNDIFRAESNESNICGNCRASFCDGCISQKHVAHQCGCYTLFCMKCIEKLGANKDYCMKCIKYEHHCENCNIIFYDETSAITCEKCNTDFCGTCIKKNNINRYYCDNCEKDREK
jgi:hypothetical protein